ncbi:hypothetical protein CRG98_041449 [Punica granatum]|uniref:Uncharacterized protein n=1 Tax=Punica granatum TaxID=22663 RepID=A0A2I0I427_PUNGR|nr:hypothetical protein CRG98_041449 [Punica granatum]
MKGHTQRKKIDRDDRESVLQLDMVISDGWHEEGGVARNTEKWVHGVSFFINLDGIEAIKGADDPNWREGVDDLIGERELATSTWGVVTGIEAPPIGIGRTLELGILSISTGGTLISAITPIRIVGILLGLGSPALSVASILSKLTKNLTLS